MKTGIKGVYNHRQPVMTVRGDVIRSLANIESGSYINLELQEVLRNRITWNDKDRSFFSELLYGTVRWQLYLDHFIARWSRRSVSQLDTILLCALRLGVYQLRFLDHVPAYAAVSETCEALKTLSPRSVGYLNGVLRRACRETLWEIMAPRESAEYLAVENSHPKWLVSRWLDNFGVATTQEIMRCNNLVPPLWLRGNSLRLHGGEGGRILDDLGLSWLSTPEIPEAYCLPDAPISAVAREIAEGFFSVQDPSAMLAALFLSPQSGESILDLCAAPGSKSCHLAELMANEGRVIALDIHQHRVELIRDHVRRTGCSIVEVRCQDGTIMWQDNPVDRVLVDAPCMGTGVFRRKVDARWKKSPSQLTALQSLQRRLLISAIAALRPGGRLLYSTCSLEPEENEENIAWLTRSYPEMTLVPLERAHLPLAIDGSGGMVTFTTASGLGDGFFIALLQKELKGLKAKS